MRALNTIGILTSLGIFWYCYYVIKAIQELLQSNFGYNNYGFAHLNATVNNLGLNGAFLMIIIGLFFLGLYIGNIKNIKRTPAKVLSIIGIIMTVVFIFSNAAFLTSDPENYFGVIYFFWIFFGLVCLSFTIVLLVQAVRDYRKKMGIVPVVNRDDMLDDFSDI